MDPSFSGHVLRGTTLAPSNAPTTGEPETGVLRGLETVPSAFLYATEAPDFVDVDAERYRAGVLEAPGTTPVEYLVWAQNSASLAWVENPDWWLEDGTATFVPGSLNVTHAITGDVLTDGSTRCTVLDGGVRSLGSVLALVIARGDVEYDDNGWKNPEVVDPSLSPGGEPRKGDLPFLTLVVLPENTNLVSGQVFLTDSQLASLGGGFSPLRGDQVVTVRYTLAPSKFWWTRNDRYETRFGWNGVTRRWGPYKGSTPTLLGLVQENQTWTLNPPPKSLPVGSYLPGDSLFPDRYSMLRVGLTPGANSVPLDSVRVKSDAEVESFDFTLDPSALAVVGQASGKLVLSPSFLTGHLGQALWFSPKSFSPDSKGDLGLMLGADTTPLYLCPVPGPTDHPMLHFGNRAPLTPVLLATDLALDSLVAVLPGTVAISMSTGKLRFCPEDLYRADPARPTFSKHFLGERVYFRGTALNAQPQPTRAPVRLLDESGDPGVATSSELYIPDGYTLAREFLSLDPRRGLGVSGVLDLPDGTGTVPNSPGTEASLRPGGDTVGAQNLGRVRSVLAPFGDSFLFTRGGALEALDLVLLAKNLPSSRKIKGGRASVAQEKSTFGSKAVIGRADRKKFGAQAVYFLQAALTPALYTETPVLYSRVRDLFRFSGTEVFHFALDGVAYQWSASALDQSVPYFTAEEVASSLQTSTVPALPGGSCSGLGGRVGLHGITSVEIGYGLGGTLDLSGCASLGFLPGWRAESGVPNWLPDSGVSLGLHRSPLNLDRSSAIPDFKAVDRVTDLVLQENVTSMPFVFLDQAPLQDVAGFDVDVFFYLRSLTVDGDEVSYQQKPLEHYQDIVHRFADRKFDWVEWLSNDVTLGQKTSTLNLGGPNLVPESYAVGGGLSVAEMGGYLQDAGVNEYILPQQGVPGIATLVTRYGASVASGSRGQVTGSSVFSDPDAHFLASGVQAGFKLQLKSGDPAGFYRVEEVLGETQVRVAPEMLSSSVPLTWELYTGFPASVFDPSLVADVQYKPFQHLLTDPFTVRVLHPMGVVLASMTDRPHADLTEALILGRDLELRFGLVHQSGATVTPLAEAHELGGLANDVLVLEDSTRVDQGSFALQIGTEVFSGSELVGVSNFSPVVIGVEYLTQSWLGLPKGTLRFSSGILSSLSGASVFYRELFRDPSALTLTEAEIDSGGYLNLSSVAMTTYAGQSLYVAERLVTENHRDVHTSPQSGSFSPNAPLKRGSIMEVEYWRADLEGRRIGDKVVEFLPVRVRKETATRTSANVYQFNSTAQTVVSSSDPDVWVGTLLQNFGRTDFLIDYPSGWGGKGRITFTGKLVDATSPVSVSYSVLEAQGGERSYAVSQQNVYSPPFYVKASQSRFGLRGNRTADFVSGQLLRIGEDCFYVKGLRYFPASGTGGDVTEVSFYPPTTTEVGSRSPGNDVLTLITDRPLTPVVDPDGLAPLNTTADAGLMSTLDINLFPFENVARGQKTIQFKGDLLAFALPGHILELGGCPYTVASSGLTPDGTGTWVTVTGSFGRAFDVLTSPTLRLSYRPVYPPSTRDFMGVGPVLTTEPVFLILFGDTQNGVEIPGRLLVPGVDYSLAWDSGALSLLSPSRAPLSEGQSLVLLYTQTRAMQPQMRGGVLVNPRFHSEFLAGTSPSGDNGRLGATLSATYTFASPDSFYFRAVKLSQFMGEVAQEATQEITAQRPAGSFNTSISGTQNWKQGVLGPKARRQHLHDVDRVARSFLSFYNDATSAFEQVQETISGGFVGDRDGKFRFWVGRDANYPTPGYEDAITGVLNPRFVWSDVMNADRSVPLFVGPEDWVVSPKSAKLVDSELEGTFLDPSKLATLISSQQKLVRNDVDDQVLLRLGKATPRRIPQMPYFEFRAQGVTGCMSDQHGLSRLFPTQTKAFFRTLPGAGAQLESGGAFSPGVYTSGREIAGQWARTTGQQIGQLSNPAMGPIENVSSANLTARRARARIWGYFPEGLPAGAFDGGLSPAVNVPCLIVSPLLLSSLPIDPETGFPDDSQFLSQGGDLGDALAGDPELSVPGFQVGDQVLWGKPDGSFLGAFTTMEDTIWGTVTKTSAFVNSVVYGCVLTFQDADGVLISDPNDLLAVDLPAHMYPLEKGDTVLAISPTGGRMTQPSALATMPTIETMRDSALRMESYRSGVDLGIRGDGSLVDRSLPSLADHHYFPLKEMTGQNPPDPMSALEGPVEFLYQDVNPYRFPALSGGLVDDSGDTAIPYLRIGNTEIDRFGEITVGVAEAIQARSGTPPDLAVYPDEIRGLDGLLIGGALTTASDFTPVANGSTDLGVGDVRPYDLLLVQTPYPGVDPSFTGPSGLIQGPHGLLSVGSVTTSTVSPPRFITPTAAPPGGTTDTGDGVRYRMSNAIVYADGIYPVDPQAVPTPGVILIEDHNVGLTILDLSDVPLALNNGETIGVGNLNDIYASGVPIQLRVIARPDPSIQYGPAGANPLPSLTGGVEILRILIRNGSVYLWTYQDDPTLVPPASMVMGSAPVFGTQTTPVLPVLDNRQIHLPMIGLLPWTPGAPPWGWSRTNWFLPHTFVGGVFTSLYGFEFLVDLDARGFDAWAPAPPAWHSATAWLDSDRITFHEICDLRYMGLRGETHPLNANLSLETTLVVSEVQTGLTAATKYWSSVNAKINGLVGVDPIPLTFLAQGTWAPRVGALTERGSLAVEAFEGWDNAPISGADIAFSAVPSCSYGKASTLEICKGSGLTGSRVSSLLVDTTQVDNRVTGVALTEGGLDQIVSGDLLIIDGSTHTTSPGSLHCGTYLVRHAIVPNAGNNRLESPHSQLGLGGWCSVQFPTVLGYNLGTHTLTTSHLAPAPGGPLVGTIHSGFALPGVNTRVFILCDPTSLASTDESKFRHAVISGLYTSITEFSGQGSFALSDYRDAYGDPITESLFQSLALVGTSVSGMVFLPVRVSGYGLPENNCVGFDDGVNSIHGFQRLTITPPDYLSLFATGSDNALPRVFKASGQAGLSDGLLDRISGVNTLVPLVEVPALGHQFLADPATPVYHHVVTSLNVTSMGGLNYDALNVPSGSFGGGLATGARCLLPGTMFQLVGPDGALVLQPGFAAQAGVFLEPSIPRTCLNLDETYARVVDAGHSLPDPSLALSDWDRELWMRDASEYWLSGSLPSVPEEVLFSVRRIRRFHDVGASPTVLKPLRYVYEIRRGFLTDRSTMPSGCDLVTASNYTMDWETTKPGGAPKASDVWSDGSLCAGTNLGPFTSADVSIHPGDLFRLLDPQGDVLEEVPIVTVLSETQLILAPPGLTLFSSANSRFEIWLRRAPVPHEQTAEQLLQLVTTHEVTRTEATWGDPVEKGGYVPEVGGVLTYEDVVNKLYDDLRAAGSGNTFSALGVRKGDLVVIDPLGRVPRQKGLPSIQELSARPFGDEAVLGRVDFSATSVFTPGAPSPLDDNRGFYRVQKVEDTGTDPYLLLNPVTEFTGTADAPVIFDSTDLERAYSVYPTVSGSLLTTLGVEGQMDLRPTRPRNPITGGFKVQPDGLNLHSLRPFSYRIYRPSGFFEPETVDLVLSTRERVKSLIELINRVGQNKGGSYFVFQRDQHLLDLGTPSDPESGSGLASNAFLRTLIGPVETMPYANSSSCLSLLDRRFWILDTQLDSLTYAAASGVGMRRALPGDPTYTEFNTTQGEKVRPVLPDLVDSVLEQTEKLRDLRYTWLSYRTHKMLGSLAAISRYDAELSAQSGVETQYLLRKKSLETS